MTDQHPPPQILTLPPLPPATYPQLVRLDALFYTGEFTNIYFATRAPPEGVQEPTSEVLRALLQKRPETRLASFDALRAHAFFASIDWDALAELRVEPPFVPTLDDVDDMRYVPDRVSSHGADLPPTPYKKGDSMRKLFRNFSHRGSFGAGAESPTGASAADDAGEPA